MKKFCESLREHLLKIIIFKIEKSSRSHIKMQKSVLFVKKNLKKNISKIKNIIKLEIIVIMQENIEMLGMVYVI